MVVQVRGVQVGLGTFTARADLAASCSPSRNEVVPRDQLARKFDNNKFLATIMCFRCADACLGPCETVELGKAG